MWFFAVGELFQQSLIIGVIPLTVKVGDRVEMKKPHPCGAKIFSVLRVGMDYRLKCEGCGHEVMLPRRKAEKGIKLLITE